MPYSHSSQRSHEESLHQKRAGDRVWMEALEGRVLLSSAQMLDLSQVEHRTGDTEGEFQFQGKAGQQYLFLDLEDWSWIHVLDARGVELAVGNDDDTYQNRLLWTAPANALYMLWLDGGDNGEGGYDLIARTVGDDYGNTFAKAAPLVLGGTIQGSIEDPLDDDVFSFGANQGDRWMFRLNAADWSINFSILDDQGNEVVQSYDGSDAMPYSGTYYVKITGDAEGYGDYEFSTKRIIDNEGGIDDAAPLKMGQPVQGSIDFRSDGDWYWFDATAGTMYVFSDGSHDEEHVLSLYDSHGSSLPLYSNPDSTYDWGRGDWLIPADGRYFVQISYYNHDMSYTLNGLIQQTADPAAASIELKSDAPISGSIDSPGGSQYFVVHAAERGTYTLSIPETSLEAGLIVAKMREGGGGTDYFDQDIPGIRFRDFADSIIWTAPSAGTYYFFVRSYDPLASGTYQIQVTEELDDHGNDAQTATPLQPGVPVDGIWQYWNDQDWFKLDVVEGEQYVFNLQSDGSGWGGMFYRRKKNGPPPPTTGLTVYDPDGNALAGERHFTPANLKLEWKATYSGTVYVAVGADEMRTDYRLVASTAAGDPQPARPLTMGELVEGSLSQHGDLVRMRFSPEPGKVYVIDASVDAGNYRVVAANGDDTMQKYVNLHDGCGNWGWTVSAPGDYFMEITASDATNYSLKVSEYVFSPCARDPEEDDDDEEDSQAPSTEYQGVEGTLADANDVRDYAFEARVGQALRFETELDTLKDSWLAIYAADGTLLAQNDDISSGWGSSEVIWKARADGIYYVRVGGFGAGSFRLLAYERTPDETPVEVQEIFNRAGDAPDLQSPVFAEHVHHQEDSMSDDLEDPGYTDSWNEVDWEDQL